MVFLVEQHLTMSQVAQKQDLADPDVILAFAAKVGSMRKLTALYLLTVADIRGTSPKVWNAWKGKLLEDLFRMTAGVLKGSAVLQLSGVAERQEEARRILRYHGLRADIELELWNQLDTGYFMRNAAEEIAGDRRTHYQRPPRTPRRCRPRVGRARTGAKGRNDARRADARSGLSRGATMTDGVFPLVELAIQLCVARGVCDFVVAPGSRSAPLTIALARHPEITLHVVYDERVAGYVALGMAQQLRRAVGLLCTSGTAAMNFGPAVVEDLFQQKPLAVAHADRPPDRDDQPDNQDIPPHKP